MLETNPRSPGTKGREPRTATARRESKALPRPGWSISSASRGVPRPQDDGPWAYQASRWSLRRPDHSGGRAHKDATIPNERRSADLAAWYPHIPWTPPPGGVDDEQM